MILLSHPTGNENVRQAARAFQEADLLGEFWTCLNWNPDSVINRAPAKIFARSISAPFVSAKCSSICAHRAGSRAGPSSFWNVWH